MAQKAMTYGERVRTARKDRMLTLRDVAALSGVTLGYLSEIERDLATPSIATAQKLADALDINPITTSEYAGAYADGERAGYLAGCRAMAKAMTGALLTHQPWAIPTPDESFAEWLAARAQTAAVTHEGGTDGLDS